MHLIFIIINSFCMVLSDSYINQRNRIRNLIDAENALRTEVADMKAAVADPFTRRHCRPTLVTRVRSASHFSVVMIY